ncbi:coniferyl-alcohol dehydrogenase [Actinomadura barringtoniae]|uniref:Coniferyl-alcohol dehydrogenase n=1 Tax=Actinomadura barringtoniae TaxID=1427535 RepID=A0A939T7J7_9ACTN|nr:coniferyl-alcohol dehydrogenase [Actinomadura barringtoniae]MBO2453188.1 coniferyl-alcohol dehydrogenase [Actinomadura barringtoniae]
MTTGDYSGRRVVVTGCASGIGERLAAQLADRGAQVIGLDRRRPRVHVESFHPVDLSDSESIGAAATAIDGPVDALFNVAGISGTVGSAAIVGVNFVGTRELTDALLPRMPAGAAIANTGSIAGSHYQRRRDLVTGLLATTTRDGARRWCDEHADELGTGYSVSKDAVIWYTLHRSVELAERGIRMNCVCPGLTETPILADSRRARGAAFLDGIPMPLGRVAEPAEQASVLAFVNSPGASYLNGQVLWVDGGYMAGVQTGRLPNTTGAAGKADGS